jgi:D-sedoheptulose 7-phosphate isomerase
MKQLIRNQLRNTLETLVTVKQDDLVLEKLAVAAQITADALRQGNKLMVAGNGGSAANSQHLAAELVGRFTLDGPALRATALTTDSSRLTGIGNDHGLDRVFDRQIEVLGQPGDFFLAISTSGDSPNLLCALKRCRAMGIATLGFTGGTGGKMLGLCDQTVVVPSTVPQKIQEAHLVLEHIFCGLVERCCLGVDEWLEMSQSRNR